MPADIDSHASAHEPILRAEGIGKHYPPATTALDSVQFSLKSGEVHALVGENGAGKSTLSKIFSGLIAPGSGGMHLDGEVYSPSGRREAENLGVRIVTQELNLIPTMTVAESLYFDRLPQRFGIIDRGRLRSQAKQLLESLGLNQLDPDSMIGSLGIGKQQLVEIAAGIAVPCKVFILDEPTAALTQTEVEILFQQLARLKAEGTAILYISHRMEEIARIADRVTVLRDGCVAGEHVRDDFDLNRIISLMVGRDISQSESSNPTSSHTDGIPVLQVSGLSAGPLVREVSFDLKRGEILGFAGLMGAGRTETMRALFGVDPKSAGTIRMGKNLEPVKIQSPGDAVRHGMAFVSEDRKGEGLFLSHSIAANIAFPSIRTISRKAGIIDQSAETSSAELKKNELGIRCHSVNQPVSELSGGNQQKVVIAKWIQCQPDIFIFDEPTRGIDIGARFEIYQLLNQLAHAGKAILMVSSDMQELLMMSHRIAVMSQGKLVTTFTRTSFNQEKIMEAALSEFLTPSQTITP